MRIIDYYNIIATVAELALVFGTFFSRLRSRNRNMLSSASSAAAVSSHQDRMGSSHSSNSKLSRKTMFAAAALLIFGAFLRMWNLTGLPSGLQQDEASIGYEAFCLATTGMDRNGYHWPVYPITWGSGGGSPLMIYLNVITTKLFGPGVWSIRIIPAFLGTLTLLLFFLLLRKAFGDRTALVGLLSLSVMPWHIILSRWSLDSNTMPFWQLLAICLMVWAASAGIDDPAKNAVPNLKKCEQDDPVESSNNHSAKTNPKKQIPQTMRYLLAAFAFGVCLYSYGSANIVIPLTILFSCIFLLRQKLLSFSQLVLCFVVFLVTCVPLAIFYGVNFLNLPEIAASWISFPKFTSSHFSSVFVSLDSSLPGALWNNLKDLVRTLTVGLDGEVSWNAMPGYWTLYLFTWPVTLAGVLFGRTRCNHDTCKNAADAATADHPFVSIAAIADNIFLAALLAALIFSLFIQQDINREVLLFLPLVYWFVKGLRWMWTAGRSLAPVAVIAGEGNQMSAPAKRRRSAGHTVAAISLLILLVGFASFAKDYYGGTYNEIAATDFMPGYGDAMIYANEKANEKDGSASSQDCTVYSTYDLVASPFMLTLYYTCYDPQEFRDTVIYKDPEAEFRVASSFGHFVFGLPVSNKELSSLTDAQYQNDVFVLTKTEAERMNPDHEDYEITTFEDRFVVVLKK